MLQFKEGIQLTITKAINEILLKAEPCFTSFSVPCVVTSGTDGQHGEKSKHYSAEALDFRVRHLKVDLHQPLVKLLKERLGKDFDVVYEGDHVHIEFDPKGEGRK